MSNNTQNSNNSFYKRWAYPILLMLVFLGVLAVLGQTLLFIIALVVFLVLVAVIVICVCKEKETAKLEAAEAQTAAAPAEDGPEADDTREESEEP